MCMIGYIQKGEMVCPKCHGVGKVDGWTCDLCNGKQHLGSEKGQAWIKRVTRLYMRCVLNDVNLEDEMIERVDD